MKASLELLRQVEAVAREAGALILQVYAGNFEVRGKADASPVTEADERAERCIVPALWALDPAVPVVAEEAASRGATPAVGNRFWLVDPLDGTREFVSRNGEFTVNIALIEDGAPVLGVVFEPVADRLYAGAVGLGAWLEERGEQRVGVQGVQGVKGVRRAIACRQPGVDGLVLACSRSHGDEAALSQWLGGWLGTRTVLRRVAVGSSLKFGLLAAGQADIYPRLGRTMEWDTAAGHAVLRAAGGEVRDLAGAPLRYGKPGFENPHFVAQGLP